MGEGEFVSSFKRHEVKREVEIMFCFKRQFEWFFYKFLRIYIEIVSRTARCKTRGTRCKYFTTPVLFFTSESLKCASVLSNRCLFSECK